EYLLKLVKDNNIIIDGSFEDWLPIPPLITYPEKQLELKITKSKNSLFFYLSYKFSNEKENVKSITPFLVIFFDTDNDPTTGLSIVRTSNQEKESNSTFGSNAVLINSSLIKQDHNTVYSKETGFADIRTGNSIPGNQMMEIELPLTLLFDNNEYEEGDTFKIVTCFVYDGQYMTLNDEPILLAILDESVSPEEQR
ncbi:MAG: hypothetical protein K9L62_16820, partial [Vallitaleaceae bacterium]|nr:hypothetical protein [Vallitaleaceae bacterium]